MRLMALQLELWDKGDYPEANPSAEEKFQALRQRFRYFDFERDAAAYAARLAQRDWREWLCAPRGEDDELGGPRPMMVETMVEHSDLGWMPVLVMVALDQVMISALDRDGRLVAYPLAVSLRDLSTEEYELRAFGSVIPPEKAHLREFSEELQRCFYHICYGPGVFMEERPPPLTPVPVSREALVRLIDVLRSEHGSYSRIVEFYGAIFPQVLACLSLLWAERETVDALPRKEARVSRLHNREGRRQQLPETTVIPYTLLRKLVAEHVDTGRLRQERERRHHRAHEVTAHWRRLRSGRVVPVRGHRRGDPSLGEVRRHVHRVTMPGEE